MFISQESLIFFPKKLPPDYTFKFDQPFEEMIITVDNETSLHGLLFKADSSKGLIFYLHGNAGALDSWGWAYETYVRLHYDFFILDYRGYGKSDGKIKSEEQLSKDIQKVYDNLKKVYAEKDIVIIGYSLGSGIAAKLTAENNPRLLILQAPYYSFIDLKDHIYPFIPDFIVKYKFETYRFLDNIKSPVYIFHGEEDTSK